MERWSSTWFGPVNKVRRINSRGEIHIRDIRLNNPAKKGRRVKIFQKKENIKIVVILIMNN